MEPSYLGGSYPTVSPRWGSDYAAPMTIGSLSPSYTPPIRSSSYVPPVTAQRSYGLSGYDAFPTSRRRSSYVPPVTSTYASPTRSSYIPPVSSTYASPRGSSYVPPVTSTYASPTRSSYVPPVSSTYASPRRSSYVPPVSSSYGLPVRSSYEPLAPQRSYIGSSASVPPARASNYVSASRSVAPSTSSLGDRSAPRPAGPESMRPYRHAKKSEVTVTELDTGYGGYYGGGYSGSSYYGERAGGYISPASQSRPLMGPSDYAPMLGSGNIMPTSSALAPISSGYSSYGFGSGRPIPASTSGLYAGRPLGSSPLGTAPLGTAPLGSGRLETPYRYSGGWGGW